MIVFNSTPRRVAGVLAAAALICWSETVADGQGDTRVACLPDKVVAMAGDSVLLRTWVASSAGGVTTGVLSRWEVSAGRLDESPSGTTWLLEGAAIDQRHIARAVVEVNGALAGSCSLGVWVTPARQGAATPVLRGEFVSRGALLRTGQFGEPGYGLYSYFLMREPMTPAERTRATRFIAAFFDVLVNVADQELYVERRQLNGSYLPVTMDAPVGLSADQRVAWILEHYDYSRARAFLSLYPTLTGPGPFIVAVPSPLRTPVRPMLRSDFGGLDDAAIADGVSRFVNQAAQLYDWQNQSTLERLRDQLLVTFAGMFVGRAQAERWLQIVR